MCIKVLKIYENIVVNSHQVVTIRNHGPATYVTMYTSAAMSVVLTNRRESGTRYELRMGNNASCMKFAHGMNTLSVYGTGRLLIYFNEGRL